MSTLKWAKREGRATNDVAEAVEIIYERNPYHHVILYASNEKKLSELIKGVNDEIKKRNTEIEDVNQVFQWMLLDLQKWKRFCMTIILRKQLQRQVVIV